MRLQHYRQNLFQFCLRIYFDDKIDFSKLFLYKPPHFLFKNITNFSVSSIQVEVGKLKYIKHILVMFTVKWLIHCIYVIYWVQK